MTISAGSLTTSGANSREQSNPQPTNKLANVLEAGGHCSRLRQPTATPRASDPPIAFPNVRLSEPGDSFPMRTKTSMRSSVKSATSLEELRRGKNLLHIVCDLSEEYSEKCIKLFHKLRARNSLIKARCFGISFADDARHGGLQAADLIAYCSRADHLRATWEPEPIVEELITILATHKSPARWFVWKARAGGIGHGELE